MTKTMIKRFNLAYNSLSDLSSSLRFKYDSTLDKLNKDAIKLGYEFKLNDKTQKFRLVRVKE